MRRATFVTSLLLLSMFTIGTFAQDLKTLEIEDYDQWESLRSSQMSEDGVWVAYQVAPNEGNDTLFIVNTLNDSLYTEAFGTRVSFTSDSKFALYLIGVSKKKQEQLQEKKETVHYKLAVLNLASGKKDIYKEVSSFSLPEKGNFALLNMYKPKGVSTAGSDKVLFNLYTGTMRTLGNLTDASFNKSGEYLAYITEPANALGYGVEVLDLSTNVVNILASDTSKFSGLTWHKEGNSLAFFHQNNCDDFEEDNFEIMAFRNISKGWKKEVFGNSSATNFPEKMKISDSRLQWSDDQSKLFFGIQDWTAKENKKKDDKNAEKTDSDSLKADNKDAKDSPKEKLAKKDDVKLPGVDVWHWRDPEIQPRQKKTYASDKNFAYQCVWDLNTNMFRQITDSIYRSARLTGDFKYAIIYTEKPYEPQFRLTYSDYQLVDLATGSRKDLLTKFTGYINSSPGGKYLVYFKDKNWHTYDITTGKHTNLTGSMDLPFWDIRDDHPAEVRPPWGMVNWTNDDKHVLISDEYDVWAFKPDGSGADILTEGRKDEIILRVRKMDYEKDYIDTKETIYFTAFGDKTKNSGYYTLKWGKKPVELIYEAKSISSYGFSKAKKADRYMWTENTYVMPPTLMVADAGLTNKKQVVQINAQQAKYAWGKAELVSFTNANGKDLQGVLHYPANYEEGKKYPMLVYIYEIRSNSLHSYINPSEKSFYNTTNYVQQGFFVFQPDIVYRLDDPGISAVECVVPAVEKVLSTGMIDKDRIGLMGHSWGAYQTAFIITQTDLFSAAVAGAPLTDMISMYTEVYWNSGSPNQGIFETSQGRFTKPYWEIMDKYLENSPMFQAQNINTPLLVAFGDQDGAVDWHQGIELYTTMRRMEKPYVMLVYEGENHSVRKEENTLDYTLKINQWFNHYLLGKDAEKWITDGIPYLEKKKAEEKNKKK